MLILLAAGFALTLGLLRRNREHPFRTYPSRGPVIEAVYGLGKVTAYSIFEFRPGVSVLIQKLFVHEGDLVIFGAAVLSSLLPAIFASKLSPIDIFRSRE